MPEMTRDDQIAAIRALADALEAHPEVPIPVVWLTHYAYNLENARQIRAQMPTGWTKTNHKTSSYMSYAKQFCPNADPWTGVQYTVEVSKNDTCERVQTGTRHVEAVEAHDEPVYEWVCGPETDNGDDVS